MKRLGYANSPGTVKSPRATFIASDKKNPTRGACTICAAMSDSGVPTGMAATITLSAPKTIQKVQVPARTAFSAATDQTSRRPVGSGRLAGAHTGRTSKAGSMGFRVCRVPADATVERSASKLPAASNTIENATSNGSRGDHAENSPQAIGDSTEPEAFNPRGIVPCAEPGHRFDPSKPIIQSVTVTPASIVAGEVFTVTIVVKTDTKLSVTMKNWYLRQQGGGLRLNFFGHPEQIEPGRWKFVGSGRTSKWALCGRYSIEGVDKFVRSAKQDSANYWEGESSLTVTNDHPASKPVIQEIKVTPERINAGGEFSVTMRIKSDAPLHIGQTFFRLTGSRNQKTRGLVAVGGAKEVSPGLWEYVGYCRSSPSRKKETPGRYLMITERVFTDEIGQYADPWPNEVAIAVSE